MGGGEDGASQSLGMPARLARVEDAEANLAQATTDLEKVEIKVEIIENAEFQQVNSSWGYQDILSSGFTIFVRICETMCYG